MLGAHVEGYALPPEKSGGLIERIVFEDGSKSVIEDIRNRERLFSEIISFKPDFIFHLAAQPLVRRSYNIPSETFEVNVVGTANLLEAVRILENKCTVVVITTDKVYDNKELDILYNESDSLGGHDPYSASKACAEFVVSSFRNSFFQIENIGRHQKGIASARAGNVIGGGDYSDDRLIPDIVRAMKKGTIVEVRNPDAIRPWQHVLEPLGGYLQLGARVHDDPVRYSGAYNFGPAPEGHLTVRELVELSIGCWGKGGWKDVSDRNQPHEAGILQLDISKARELLGWNPKLNARKSIDWTIDWYKNEQSSLEFSRSQILNYMNT
jgi:CDP-glucose 4,6-dehydratase